MDFGEGHRAMFRKAWKIVKAFLNRQDGRVPADPELHMQSFGKLPPALPTLLFDLKPVVHAAVEPAPASGKVSGIPETARKASKPLHAQRLASVAKLNRPVSAKANVDAAGQLKNGKGKRSPQAQAWIVAGRQKKQPPRAANVVAFPARPRMAASRKAA